MKVLRLQELTEKQVNDLAAFIKDAIHTEKSEWVCQAALRAGSFSDSYTTLLRNQSEPSALPSLHTDRWIALDKNKPVGICCVARGGPDRAITLFLVDSSLSPAEQLKVSDTLALQSIKDVLADQWGKQNFISCLPNDSPASVYAKLCGMEVVEPGPIISKWQVGVEEMRDIILERQ